jgi:hypothetical protein
MKTQLFVIAVLAATINANSVLSDHPKHSQEYTRTES